MSEKGFKTIGTKFVEDISTAKNSDELFGILKDTCSIVLSPEDVAKSVKDLNLPASAVNFKAAVAKMQIEKRSKVINQKLSKIQGKENIRSYYKKYLRQEREIPQVANYTYIAMQTYINKGFGKAEEFKKELYERFVKPVMEQDNQNMNVPSQLLQQTKNQGRQAVYGR